MDQKALALKQQLDEMMPYFHQMFDDSMENIAIFNLDCEMVYMNPTLKTTLGIQSTEAHKAFKLSHESPFHPAYNAIKQVIDTGQSTDVLMISPSIEPSRAIYDQIFLSPIRSASGEMIAVYTAGRDMHRFESKQNAEEKQHNTYLRALLDNFPFIVWMKDKEGRYLEVNQKLADLVHESAPAKLFGKTDFDYFSHQIAQAFVNDDHEILNTNQPKNTEELIENTDGSTYWAETYKSPVAIDGETIGTVGFARDVSQRHELEAEVKKISAEFQSLVGHLPMAIFRYDKSCKRTFVNSLHKKHLEAFKLGVTPAEDWHPDILNMTADDYMQMLRDVLTTGEIQTFELKAIYQGRLLVMAGKMVAEYDEENQIASVLTISQDITKSYEYQQKIEHLAYYDTITQLPNRAKFNERLVELSRKAITEQTELSLLMLDLDHFKNINDSLGHDWGDRLLAEVAIRISAIMREDDFFSRISGDEFAILTCAVKDKQNLTVFAKKIIKALSSPFVIEDKELFITASIGIASYPTHTNNPENLLKFADGAMYMAKNNGRNNYQFFSAEIDEETNRHLILQTELRHAIVQNELSVHYQAIYDLVTGKTTGYEALMRWKNKKLGQVNPKDFIMVAEEFGIIVELGDWMIHQVCKHAAVVNRQRETPLTFSINLSPRQFTRHDIVKTFKQALSEHQCAPAWVKVEITENLLISSQEDTPAMLQAMWAMGLDIMIDDFGTGYSSLSYLNKYPISIVKIDQSFIRDITADANDAKLVKGVIEMCKGLGKPAVAEGVETQAQLEMLRDWGCQFVQGYLLAKPLPPDQINWAN